MNLDRVRWFSSTSLVPPSTEKSLKASTSAHNVEATEREAGVGIRTARQDLKRLFNTFQTQVAATRGQNSSLRLTSTDYGSSPNQNGLPLVMANGLQPHGAPVGPPQRSQRLPQQLEEWYHGRLQLQHQQYQQQFDPVSTKTVRPTREFYWSPNWSPSLLITRIVK